MKLLFDENLSPRLVWQLATEFPGSTHVRDVGLAAAPDRVVWAFAAANAYTVASKDADFQQRVSLLGHPPKEVWLRLGNSPTSAVAALLRLHRTDLLAFGADPVASFLALS